MNYLIALELNFIIVSINALRVMKDELEFYSFQIVTQGLIAVVIVLIFYLVSLKWWKE